MKQLLLIVVLLSPLAFAQSTSSVDLPDGSFICWSDCGRVPPLTMARRFVFDDLVCDTLYKNVQLTEVNGIHCYKRGSEPQEPDQAAFKQPKLFIPPPPARAPNP
jgi:hypothetical protein